MNPYPIRKSMNHTAPARANVPAGAFYFITVCAADRTGAPFADAASAILDAARFYHDRGTWFLRLLLVMPDHLHMLVHFPPGVAMANVMRNLKRYLSKTAGLRFQNDFFDTRIRDAAHFAEKWDYIVKNPVRRGLVENSEDWPHRIEFPAGR